MKIVNIIGFIIILLGDIALFATSMSMPAGGKTTSAFLLFSLLTLIIIIIHLVAGIKESRLLVRISSVLLILVSVISFLTSGNGNYSADVAEYGQYYNGDDAIKIYFILVLLNIVFGIIGLIFSFIKKKQTEISI